MNEFYPDDEDYVMNSPPDKLTNDELRWEILDRAKRDPILSLLLKDGKYPTGDDYISLNYGDNIPDFFEGNDARICELLEEYNKRLQKTV